MHALPAGYWTGLAANQAADRLPRLCSLHVDSPTARATA